ncbi:MAG: SGNH/GDSL hydrolase family protein [Pseudomonadota bacterium]
MSSAVSMTGPKFYAWDNSTGKPLAFGKVYTYAAGTNTPKATYYSEDATVTNPNPVILNGAGYADIYLRGRYKIVVKDENDVEVWTSDPVSDASSLLQPWIQETAAEQVAPDQFKVTGNKTDIFRYGRSVKLDDTVIFYGTVLGSQYMSGETLVTIDAVDDLTSDLSRAWASLVDMESLLPVLKDEAGETLVDAVTASLATFEPRMQERFSKLLSNSGYEFLDNYQQGIELTEYNQVVRDTSGELWRVAPSQALPYTTTGAGLPEGGAFLSAGDAALRQDIDSGTASTSSLTGSQAIAEALNNRSIVSNSAAFGASSGATNDANLTALQDAVDYAISDGLTDVIVDDALDIPTSGELSGRSNAVLTGSGSLGNTNADTSVYRRDVIPRTAPAATSFPDYFEPIRFIDRGDPIKIVVVGDSLTTYGADALSARDVLTQFISRKFKSDNPGVDFEIVSRGIGAQQYTNIDSIPSTSYSIADRYPWYTDDQRPWLDYVADLNPDYVILSSGMNDKQNFDRAALESVVSKVEAMGAEPIFVTNMVPNLAPHPDYSGFASYADQEGRDFAAGWVRTYALYYGYRLIDINRTFNITRDGRDILNTYLKEQPAVTFNSASAYTPDNNQACRDFSLRAVIDLGAWDSAAPMAVRVGPGLNNVVFIRDDGGFVRFQFYRGGSNSLYADVTSGIPTPSGDAETEISVKGNYFSFRFIPSIAGSEAGSEPFTQKIIKYGGAFLPTVSYFSGSGGPLLSATLSIGVETQHKPSITDLELWGIPSASASTREVTGGNGVNHPSSNGAAHIYGLHFANQRYTFEKTVEVIDGGADGIAYKYPDGRLECELIREISGGATNSLGAIFVGAPVAWAFPVEFDSPPVITGSADDFDFDVTFNDGGSSPTISNGYRLRSVVSSTSTVTVRLKASGRWSE